MKLSYANVTATIALVLAIGGGTVYAAQKIRGKDIKAKAIKGKHLATNSVKGRQVKESKLKAVPAADSVGGVTVTTIDESLKYGNGKEVLSAGESVVFVNCQQSPDEVAVLPANSTAAASLMSIDLSASTSNPSNPEQIVENPAPSASNGLASDGTVSGSVTVRQPSGKITRLDITALHAPNAFGSGDDCLVSGTVSTFGG